VEIVLGEWKIGGVIGLEGRLGLDFSGVTKGLYTGRDNTTHLWDG
jgi:hypothetical protein